MKYSEIIAVLFFMIVIQTMYGKKWETITNTGGTTSFHFLDEQTGWIIKNGESLLRTTDGGKNWMLQMDTESPIEEETSITSSIFTIEYGTGLTDVYFVDKDNGWVSSWLGGVYYTSNSGKTWHAQEEVTYSCVDICFIDVQRGWACGPYYAVIKTEDGGKTWQDVSLTVKNPYIPESFDKIFFLDTLRGWIGGMGVFFKTDDGGKTWVQDTVNDFGYVNDIFFHDSLHGWLALGHSWGAAAQIMKTTDAGNTYEVWEDSECLMMQSVRFLDLKKGYACGGEREDDYMEIAGKGIIYETNDGGECWKKIRTTDSFYFQIQYLPSGTVLFGSKHGILRMRE